MQNVSDVIALWPSPSLFAAEVGIRPKLVKVWRHRRSIPSGYWAAIEAAAGKRGIVGASASDLARLAARTPLNDAPERAA